MLAILLLSIVSIFAQDCTLTIPADPLTAQGLSTPFELAGAGCSQTNPNGQTFVEAAILDTTTGAIAIYHPLVVDAGTKPLMAPVVPVLPKKSQVALWFGSNANSVTLIGAGANQCVNGAKNSVFGQFAYCNAKEWFKQANKLIQANTLVVPPIGTGLDGQPCPTTRDFRLVDQDQSDNLETSYLLLNGQVAQNNVANRAAFAGATEIDNGSDNRLLSNFMGPALGCTPFKAPSADDPGIMISALALNEISAAANQKAPIALVPINDPMTLNNGAADLAKNNLYRFGVNQIKAKAANNALADAPDNASGLRYCQNLINTGIPGFTAPATMALLSKFQSPVPAAGNNLFTFLASRSAASLTNLNCLTLLNIAQPWTLNLDGNGVVTSAIFSSSTVAISNAVTTSVSISTSSQAIVSVPTSTSSQTIVSVPTSTSSQTFTSSNAGSTSTSSQTNVSLNGVAGSTSSTISPTSTFATRSNRAHRKHRGDWQAPTPSSGLSTQE